MAKRGKRWHLYLTPAEWMDIKAAAERNGERPAAWGRRILLEHIRTPDKHKPA